MGVGFQPNSDSKESHAERKRGNIRSFSTCNLRPEFVDDLRGGCYVFEEEAVVVSVDDAEEFM